MEEGEGEGLGEGHVKDWHVWLVKLWPFVQDKLSWSFVYNSERLCQMVKLDDLNLLCIILVDHALCKTDALQQN
jgi:hypothetical protein